MESHGYSNARCSLSSAAAEGLGAATATTAIVASRIPLSMLSPVNHHCWDPNPAGGQRNEARLRLALDGQKGFLRLVKGSEIRACTCREVGTGLAKSIDGEAWR